MEGGDVFVGEVVCGGEEMEGVADAEATDGVEAGVNGGAGGEV